uniref:Uncharacterized protein n=1 Tax=Anser brachyrhynchus TaxID=132585 RepID=A0A8B9BFN9_9AVES
GAPCPRGRQRHLSWPASLSADQGSKTNSSIAAQSLHPYQLQVLSGLLVQVVSEIFIEAGQVLHLHLHPVLTQVVVPLELIPARQQAGKVCGAGSTRNPQGPWALLRRLPLGGKRGKIGPEPCEAGGNSGSRFCSLRAGEPGKQST